MSFLGNVFNGSMGNSYNATGDQDTNLGAGSAAAATQLTGVNTQLQNEATNGSSLAQNQLTAATGQNIQNASGMVSSQKGLNPALAARQASQNATAANQQAGNQSAQLQAQTQMAAQQGLSSNLLGQQGIYQGAIANQNNADATIAAGNAQTQNNAAGSLTGNAGALLAGGGTVGKDGMDPKMLAAGGNTSGATPMLQAPNGGSFSGGSNALQFFQGLSSGGPKAPGGGGAQQGKGGLSDLIQKGVKYGYNELTGGPGSQGAPQGVTPGTAADSTTAMPEAADAGATDAAAGAADTGAAASEAAGADVAADSGAAAAEAAGTAADAGAGLAALAAKGGAAKGKVKALLSPGERYLPPAEAKKVVEGKKSAMSAGKKVPGKPIVGGAKNDYANDTVPATLQAGGIVIPRSVTQGKDAQSQAHKFVAAHFAQKRGSLPGKKAK